MGQGVSREVAPQDPPTGPPQPPPHHRILCRLQTCRSFREPGGGKEWHQGTPQPAGGPRQSPAPLGSPGDPPSLPPAPLGSTGDLLRPLPAPWGPPSTLRIPWGTPSTPSGRRTPEVGVVHTGLVVSEGEEGGAWPPPLHQFVQHLTVVHPQPVQVPCDGGGETEAWWGGRGERSPRIPPPLPAASALPAAGRAPGGTLTGPDAAVGAHQAGDEAASQGPGQGRPCGEGPAHCQRHAAIAGARDGSWERGGGVTEGWGRQRASRPGPGALRSLRPTHRQPPLPQSAPAARRKGRVASLTLSQTGGGDCRQARREVANAAGREDPEPASRVGQSGR